jgi:hypothetical protein
MTHEPQLTPAQQNLMNFLDKLASSPYSPELMQEGYHTKSGLTTPFIRKDNLPSGEVH